MACICIVLFHIAGIWVPGNLIPYVYPVSLHFYAATSCHLCRSHHRSCLCGGIVKLLIVLGRTKGRKGIVAVIHSVRPGCINSESHCCSQDRHPISYFFCLIEELLKSPIPLSPSCCFLSTVPGLIRANPSFSWLKEAETKLENRILCLYCSMEHLTGLGVNIEA